MTTPRSPSSELQLRRVRAALERDGVAAFRLRLPSDLAICLHFRGVPDARNVVVRCAKRLKEQEIESFAIGACEGTAGSNVRMNIRIGR
jgi:hypothetical protein